MTRVTIIGRGLAAWIAASYLNEQGVDGITMVGPDEGLLDSFFGYDKGGHVYGPAAQEKLDTHGIRIDGPQIERECFYYEGEGETFKRFEYPVQHSWPGAERNPLPVYSGQSLEALGRAAFGHRFYEQWYSPFNRRVWGTFPSELDSIWVTGRVSTSGVNAKWGPNSTFKWASGMSLVRQVMFQSPGLRVITGFAKSLTYKDGKSRLVVTNPEGKAEFIVEGQDAVISTMPLGGFLDIAGRSELNTGFRFNYVTTYGVTTSEPHQGPHFTWVYPDLASPVHRVTNFAVYTGEQKMLGKYLFELPESSYKHHVGERTGEIEVDHTALPYPVVRAMRSLGIRPEKVVHAAVATHLGYPTPVLGVQEKVANVKRALVDHKWFTCGRWGSHGYFNVDHTCDDAAACAAVVLGELGDYASGHTDEYVSGTHYYSKTAVTGERK